MFARCFRVYPRVVKHNVYTLNPRQITIRSISNYPDNPFDLTPTSQTSTNVDEFLENEPSLAGFFEADNMPVESSEANNTEGGPIPETTADDYDFSELRTSSLDEDMIRSQMAGTEIPHQQQQDIHIQSHENNTSFDINQFNEFKSFYAHNELITDNLHYTPNTQGQPFSELVKADKPMIFLSKFHDPRLNLSLEKYIYDNVPNTTTYGKTRDKSQEKKPVPKRLITYINNPTIVIGKNQNPYKEINLHLASMLQVPVIRRYSGGGTVVHDLGNVNFSFINDKNEFDRVKFSSSMIELLNKWVGLTTTDEIVKLPHFELTTNPKGDIINAENLKKISGSAYQLSRGRSLHHGTMLLNSNLKNLSKLLKLPDSHKDSILDNSTDSIPSKVQNYDIANELFLYACVKAFNNNEYVWDWHDSNVVLLDDYKNIPQEVWATYKELKSWSWTFAKTPKFHKSFVFDNVKFTLLIKNGEIQEMAIPDQESGDINTSLQQLKQLIEREEGPKVKYTGSDIMASVSKIDSNLAKYLSHHIDFNFNYELLGYQ